MVDQSAVAGASVHGTTPAAVARTSSGVRSPESPATRWHPGARHRPSLLAHPSALPAAPGEPPVRWDPGARYRPSLLAQTPVAQVPRVRVAQIPGAQTPVEPVDPAARRAFLPGRLFRGPARRTAVFDRPVWYPPTGRPAALRARSAAELADAVDRYRRGALDTTGLVRAVGHALAA